MAEVVKTDVLVVGGGGAGARAALEARQNGAEVILAVKGRFGALGARGSGATAGGISEGGVFATPGWTGPLSELERSIAHTLCPTPEQGFANIIQVGLGMADPGLVRVLIEEAVEARKKLLDWGVTFRGFGMRSHGVPIMEALDREIRKANVSIRERMMVVSLLVKKGECLGAIGVDEGNGSTVIIKAGATVIATGGDANLFMLNLGPSCNTGDGYAMGYEAGAELMNLEFKQIFLGTVYPTRNFIIQPVPSHSRLINAKGEEFLQSYLPKRASPEECLAQRNSHHPFSTRDTLSKYVDIAILGELKAGRATDHNAIYLDRTDPRIPPLSADRREFWDYRGIDWTKPVQIGVCQHCSLGGFRINEKAETTVPRLYAAGEAVAGPHGADRLGGHMLLTCQVFGARAGKNGAACANSRRLPDIDSKVLNAAEERIKSLRELKGKRKPADVKGMLQKSAYFNLMVVRSQTSLNAFLSDVKGIQEELVPQLSVTSPQELVEALELQNLLLLAELEATVCLERTESRGPHYREDFPRQNDKDWLKSITVKKVDGKLQPGIIALDPAWKSKGDEKVKGWG